MVTCYELLDHAQPETHSPTTGLFISDETHNFLFLLRQFEVGVLSHQKEGLLTFSLSLSFSLEKRKLNTLQNYGKIYMKSHY